MDYKKWDKIDVSDEEEEPAPSFREPSTSEEHEHRAAVQTEVDRWLRRQITVLKNEEKEEQEKSSRMSNAYPSRSGNYGMEGDMGGRSSFMPKKQLARIRDLTKEERGVLSRMVAVSSFDEGETNLTRHPELLDLVRHHRWLETDPGTLELLCRIHNAVMRRSGSGSGATESDEDKRNRDRVLCAINTLSAAKQAKIPGGLLDLIATICTPETDAARELRKKWQRKEFAKDALFDSLFPDVRQQVEQDNKDDSMWEIWLMLFLIVAVIAAMVFFFYYLPKLPGKEVASAAKAAASAVSSAAPSAGTGPVATSAVADAVSAASAGVLDAASVGNAVGSAGSVKASTETAAAVAAAAVGVAAEVAGKAEL
eukprot:TRINITY_DN70207_c0_g1_i1.p1 TRINITY_DN70207_c0_g1~~TRINITY_DN70207_c0_g1_i1.p1  ORF type:complete len:368 (+),score=96.52 TRINITY_DN70207_c0_g1_i1:56-1159(+)